MADGSREPATILPLELRGVGFEAGGIPLIKDLTCTLERGPITAVIGPNGAGKSLFLRLCHGLIQPTSGTVHWGGAPDNPVNRQAMVFQRPVMLRRSVVANIEHVLAARKIPRSERAPRIEEVLERTGLARFATQSARTLSFGEQQKLAIARAWVLKPDVLFLDEPTASLDPAATHWIEELVLSIHDGGTRIVMTTHDLGQARRLAREILFMFRGRLLEHSEAEPFFDKPRNDLAEAYIAGEPLWWRHGETGTLKRQKPKFRNPTR